MAANGEEERPSYCQRDDETGCDHGDHRRTTRDPLGRGLGRRRRQGRRPDLDLVGSAPTGVAITPDGKHVYVANNTDGTVSVITTATGAVSGTITLDAIPNGLAIAPHGTQVYVANLAGKGGNTVSVIETATGVVSGLITVGRQPSDVAICP